MSHQEDNAYYSCRLAEEIACGEQATHPTAAAIHFELAYRYGLLAAQCDTRRHRHAPIAAAMIEPAPDVIHVTLEAA